MKDPELRLTATHAADAFQGEVLGIETHLFVWVALSLLAGLGLFLGLFYRAEQPFQTAAVWAAVPSILVIAYLRLLHQGKPPGFAQECLDSFLTRGDARPPHNQPRHPFNDA